MRPEEEDVIKKRWASWKQNEGSTVQGRLGAHGSSLDLEAMQGVEGEVVMGGDELDELVKELSAW